MLLRKHCVPLKLGSSQKSRWSHTKAKQVLQTNGMQVWDVLNCSAESPFLSHAPSASVTPGETIHYTHPSFQQGFYVPYAPHDGAHYKHTAGSDKINSFREVPQLSAFEVSWTVAQMLKSRLLKSLHFYQLPAMLSIITRMSKIHHLCVPPPIFKRCISPPQSEAVKSNPMNRYQSHLPVYEKCGLCSYYPAWNHPTPIWNNHALLKISDNNALTRLFIRGFPSQLALFCCAL